VQLSGGAVFWRVAQIEAGLMVGQTLGFSFLFWSNKRWVLRASRVVFFREWLCVGSVAEISNFVFGV
jgi:hypothetical protein